MKISTSPEPTPWRTSADTVPEATFEQYRTKLIHETPAINQFLKETRAQHFVVSAPKGFGKTLLLIAKRLQLNEHSPEIAKNGELVERLGGSFDEVSKDRTSEYSEDVDFWRRLWIYSISVAAINAHARSSQATIPDFLLKDFDKRTIDFLSAREIFHLPTVIFTTVLAFDFSSRRAALANLNKLTPLLTQVRSQVAFFIDNVDEYFAPILENKSFLYASRFGLDDQQKSNAIWNNAQLALVDAAYQIHKNYHHVRVYCTIRREAFARLESFSLEYAQIQGCTVEIAYSASDLKTIFKKNVALTPDEFLFAEVDDDDLAGRFFGPNARALRHRFVDKSESALDLLLRHTFFRPRDLMILCGKLSLVPVEERTPERIKQEIEALSIDLVQGMFTEMKPFFRLPDRDELLSCIKKNTLTIDELRTASDSYLENIRTSLNTIPFEQQNEYEHPFCVLYQIGMLGWIDPDYQLEPTDTQKFLLPRDIQVGKDIGLPPTNNYYLIHPALDRMIFDKVGREYVRNYYRGAIVGSDLSWKAPQSSHFVLKGDVCSFSKVMATEFYESTAIKLHEWAKVTCDDLEYVEVSGGDSITLIDSSAENLLHSAFHLMKRAASDREKPLTFRFGTSAGPIIFKSLGRRSNGAWQDLVLPLGQALRSSARLEPHAPIGKILADQAFISAIGGSSEQINMTELAPEDIPSLTFDPVSKTFKVQKGAADPASETMLYFVEIRS